MARGIDTPKNASFHTPSATPTDIKYRVQRLASVVRDGKMYADAIDPDGLGCNAAETHLELSLKLLELEELVNKLEAQRPSTKTETKEGRQVSEPKPSEG